MSETPPRIFINTLPKSGSVFISGTIAQSLGVKPSRISLNYFPFDVIDINMLDQFIEAGGVTQEHLDASPTNIHFLGKFLPKFVLHIRDPRQSMISWAHHVKRYRNEGKTHQLEGAWSVVPPEDMADKSVSYLLDWYIDNYLTASVTWINGWLEAIGQHQELDILLSKYEDFHQDNQQHIENILKWYGVDMSNVELPQLERNMRFHYRSGSTNEWQQLLDERQIERAGVLLSGTIREHYS